MKDPQIVPGAEVLIYNFGSLIGDGVVKTIIDGRATMETPLHGYKDHPVEHLKINKPIDPRASTRDILRSLYT